MQAISEPRIAITVPVSATTTIARAPVAMSATSEAPRRRRALIARLLSAPGDWRLGGAGSRPESGRAFFSAGGFF